MITQVKHTVPSLDRVIIARQRTETLFPYLGCKRGTATHQPHPPTTATHPTTTAPAGSTGSASSTRPTDPTSPTGSNHPIGSTGSTDHASLTGSTSPTDRTGSTSPTGHHRKRTHRTTADLTPAVIPVPVTADGRR